MDSGAGVSVLDLRVSKELRLKRGKRVTVEGVSGTTSGFWPQHMAATVGSVDVGGDFLAMDLSQLHQTGGLNVDGLIGAEFFRHHIVRIDFSKRKVRLLNQVDLAADCQCFALETAHSALRIKARVNAGCYQWFRLDTGCAGSLQWTTPDALPKISSAEMAVAFAAVSIPTSQCRLRLGNLEFLVLTGLHSKPIFEGESGLIGNGVFSRFPSVTFDVEGRRWILENPARE